MGFSLTLALSYLRSRRAAFVSLSTAFSIVGVSLGTAALSVVMSVTGGFHEEFRDKVLGVNAHVMVMKYSNDFGEYREVMARASLLPEVSGVGPFVISPMMLTHAGRTATGVHVKGVDPERVGDVLDLPRYLVAGSLSGMRTRERLAPATRSPPETPDATSRATRRGPAGGAPDGQVEDARPNQEPTQRLSPSRADLEPGSIVPPGGYESELPGDDDLPPSLHADPCAGDAPDLPGIVIGVGLGETLNAHLGECVVVTSPTIGYAFDGSSLRSAVAKRFRVIGTFRAGFEQYDAKFAYTDVYEAQAFYGDRDTVTGVELKLVDLERSAQVVQRLEAVLESRVYKVLDWRELNRGLFTALSIQQILMSAVLAVIILVAAFTVIATLIMVVMDKKREIAVLKAMGATDWAIQRAFLYQGLIIGGVGATAGLMLGYALCFWISTRGVQLDPEVYFISRLPVRVRAVEFLATGGFAVLAALSATFWPARHAARLRPAEAFRAV